MPHEPMQPVQDFSNYGMLGAFLAALAIFIGFLSFAVIYMVRDRRDERNARQEERKALAIEREAERRARELLAKDCHDFQVSTLDRYDEAMGKLRGTIDKNTETHAKTLGTLDRHEGILTRLEDRLKRSHPSIQITEPRHVQLSDSGVQVTGRDSPNVHE